MPGQIVINADALTAGLRSEFITTYRQRYALVRERLSPVMTLGIPSDKFEEIYGYYDSSPHWRRLPRGETIASKPLRAVQYRAKNVDWGIKIEWHKNDREDDQLRDLMTQARSAGEKGALIHERVFFQFLTGVTDPELMDSVPNAPDGAALYATTAAGSARFGVTGGNLLTGSGVATSAAIRADFFNAIEQFRLFQDTEGQPLWDDATLDGGYTVIYGAANEQVFREAFQQARTVQATAAGQASTGAAVSNIVLDAGISVRLWSTQRITDNDWYIFLNASPIKAIFQQEREGIKDYAETMENSDNARRTKIESIQWDARYGYGINIPYQTVKINN